MVKIGSALSVPRSTDQPATIHVPSSAPAAQVDDRPEPTAPARSTRRSTGLPVSIVVAITKARSALAYLDDWGTLKAPMHHLPKAMVVDALAAVEAAAAEILKRGLEP